MVRATHSDDLLLEDLLQGIENGTIGLPNFQRDFDWTDQDVRALLGTVLSGWPIGSLLLIEVDEHTTEFYQPRAFDAAPDLSPKLELVTLDGQQRLTALFQALAGVGRTRYALRLRDSVGLTDVDELDSAIVAIDAEVWSRKYDNVSAQWAERYIPLTALRNASDFFAWRDEAIAPGTPDYEALTRAYRSVISGLHAYRIPGVIVNRAIPPQAVARIFERVNRHGRTLGAFDLVVARSFTATFNLRKKWEDALEQFPAIRSFQKDDGLPVLAALALRQREDVRQAAVLDLRGGAIRDGWDAAVEHYAAAVDFLGTDLGVVKPDWLPYKQMLTVLTALDYERPLHEYSSQLRQWFWATGLGQRYWAASNTRAVADYRALRDETGIVPRAIQWDRSMVRQSTRQQQGALHKSVLCLLAYKLSTEHREADISLADGEGVYEYSIYPRGFGSAEPALHLRTLSFVVAPAKSASDFALEDQMITLPWEQADPDALLDARAQAIAGYVSTEFKVRISIVDEDVVLEDEED